VLGRGRALYMGLRGPVDGLDVTVAALMALFGLLELWKKFGALSVPRRWMVPGGLLSGFLGGLSGHQGALRSMFLLRAGLSKEAYIATGVAIACLVDLTRLPIYLSGPARTIAAERWPLLLLTVVMAFAGAWWGKKLVPKVTLRHVQVLVGALMVVIAVMLALGII
jgi:uncharacterized protein